MLAQSLLRSKAKKSSKMTNKTRDGTRLTRSNKDWALRMSTNGGKNTISDNCARDKTAMSDKKQQ